MPTLRHREPHYGFSLTELLLVIALSLILTMLAYSLHQQQTLKTKRLDAKLALYDLAYRIERYFEINHSYKDATLGTGKATDIKETVFSDQQCYFLSIENQSKTTYILRATAQGNQTADHSCSFFTLNQAGEKGSGSDVAVASSQCW